MHYGYIEIRATSGSALLDDKCTVMANNALYGGSGIGKLTSNFHDNVILSLLTPHMNRFYLKLFLKLHCQWNNDIIVLNNEKLIHYIKKTFFNINPLVYVCRIYSDQRIFRYW